MFYFDESSLENLIVHQIGNKNENGDILLSQQSVEMDEDLQAVLVTYFFSSFKDPLYYNFSGETLEENKVFQSAANIFDDGENLIEESKNLANHLFEQSYHPNIKSGELYIGVFRNCIVDDEVVDAVGIFKSETKQPFLKVFPNDGDMQITHDKGINIKKIDKACLIFNTEKEMGYKVTIVDVSGRSKEAHYWKDDFLGLQQRKDDYYQTQNYIGICKGFVQNVFNEDNGIEKADQIDMLNKSADYFKENKQFDIQDFEDKVIENEEVIQAFQQYTEKVSEEHDLDIKDNFNISETAVKKSRAQFKSVLKLDKNFHIYIHGDRQRIVKGFDQSNGLNYYQIFYNQEN